MKNTNGKCNRKVYQYPPKKIDMWKGHNLEVQMLHQHSEKRVHQEIK